MTGRRGTHIEARRAEWEVFHSGQELDDDYVARGEIALVLHTGNMLILEGPRAEVEAAIREALDVLSRSRKGKESAA